ncbi:MAG: Holliday junction resolvase RuvX [Cyanobium sp. MAG06]|nr:Holliday junction resolvase RuvX [Cyanobium sp. MAG06]
MKYLGVDYGSKRVGIAESDEGGKIAFPITIVDNKTALADCLELIKALNIHTVVVGESLSLAGKENKINSKVKIFAQELQEQSGKDVVFEKE